MSKLIHSIGRILDCCVHFMYLILNFVADPGQQKTKGRGAEAEGSVRGQRAGRRQGPREHRGVLQTVPPVPGPPQRGRVSVKSLTFQRGWGKCQKSNFSKKLG